MAPGQSPAWRRQFRIQLKKTKLCWYGANGECRRGKECHFAHNPSDIVVTPDLSKTSLCKDMVRGRCDRGGSCPFAHGTEELRRAPAFIEAKVSKRTKSRGPMLSDSTLSVTTQDSGSYKALDVNMPMPNQEFLSSASTCSSSSLPQQNDGERSAPAPALITEPARGAPEEVSCVRADALSNSKDFGANMPRDGAVEVRSTGNPDVGRDVEGLGTGDAAEAVRSEGAEAAAVGVPRCGSIAWLEGGSPAERVSSPQSGGRFFLAPAMQHGDTEIAEAEIRSGPRSPALTSESRRLAEAPHEAQVSSPRSGGRFGVAAATHECDAETAEVEIRSGPGSPGLRSGGRGLAGGPHKAQAQAPSTSIDSVDAALSADGLALFLEKGLDTCEPKGLDTCEPKHMSLESEEGLDPSEPVYLESDLPYSMDFVRPIFLVEQPDASSPLWVQTIKMYRF